MNTLFLLGQVYLGLYFINSGLNHFRGFNGMAGYTASKKIPAPKLAVVLTGLMLLAGGFGVLFQYQTAWAYGVLVAFLIPTALLMHNYWADQDPNMHMSNKINFQKNLALASALLMILALQ